MVTDEYGAMVECSAGQHLRTSEKYLFDGYFINQKLSNPEMNQHSMVRSQHLTTAFLSLLHEISFKCLKFRLLTSNLILQIPITIS
jgi:hypothetical protein